MTIPEGWRLEQTADALSAGGSVDGAEYLRLASDSGWRPHSDEDSQSPVSYNFLDLLPAGSSLEGYLYPDSYQLLKEGAVANFCVVDPSGSWSIDGYSFESKSSNSPFAGKALKGRVRLTVFRGERVVADGEVVK